MTYLPRSAHYNQLHIVLFLEQKQECAWKLTTTISFAHARTHPCVHARTHTHTWWIHKCVTNGQPSGTGLCSFLKIDYRITQNVTHSFTYCIYTIIDRRVTETYQNDKFGSEITHVLTSHKLTMMINKTPYLYITRQY